RGVVRRSPRRQQRLGGGCSLPPPDQAAPDRTMLGLAEEARGDRSGGGGRSAGAIRRPRRDGQNEPKRKAGARHAESKRPPCRCHILQPSLIRVERVVTNPPFPRLGLVRTR